MNLGVDTDFLLVLMWPTWPQLAHFRAVPSLLRPLPGFEEVGAAAGVEPAASETLGEPGPGEPAGAEGLPAVEALAALRALRRSRCRRRSWLRSRRASSSRIFCCARASSSLSPVGMRVLWLGAC